MQQFETTVLIVGAGPAGLTAALALSTYGIAATVITRHRWLAPTPRAHVTNQRTFELLRDLRVEADATALATPMRCCPMPCSALPSRARSWAASRFWAPGRPARRLRPC